MRKHCLFIIINGLFLSVLLFFSCATTSERQGRAESDEELTVVLFLTIIQTYRNEIDQIIPKRNPPVSQ